jgi:hypothetical protein
MGNFLFKKRKIQCWPKQTSQSKVNTQEEEADLTIKEEVEVDYL